MAFIVTGTTIKGNGDALLSDIRAAGLTRAIAVSVGHPASTIAVDGTNGVVLWVVLGALAPSITATLWWVWWRKRAPSKTRGVPHVPKSWGHLKLKL